MRITVFNGSPKAGRGNTHVMAREFLQGAQEAGAEVENVFLDEKEIRPCTGCSACWLETPGQCVHHDDMDELIPKFVSSDVVGFATPVYVDNVTGLMKDFMDRLIPIADPHWEKDENGECRHLMRYEKPRKLVVISNCGFPEQSHFQVLRVLSRRIARNIHCEVIAEIYRGGGALLTVPEPALRPLVEKYKLLLRKAGREVIQNSKLSEETTVQLEKPLLSMENYVDEFMKRVNQLCDERLSQSGS
jgi:FMN-dependent NADH-azoreductase